MNSLLSGLWLGLCYAAPLGQQNFFVIGASSKGGLRNALRVAFIVSMMDISLAVACFYGVGAVIEQWPFFESAIKGVGAIFLFYIGWNLLRPEIVEITSKDKQKLAVWSIVKSCFILTWFNVQALIDGTAIFGSMKAVLDPNHVNYFILGSALGSAIWFFTICIFFGLAGSKISPRFFRWVNSICGIMLMGFGMKLVVSLATEITW